LCKIVSSCTEFSVATTQCYSDDSKFTAKVVTVHKTNIDYHVAALSYAVERRGLMSLKQNSWRKIMARLRFGVERPSNRSWVV